MEEAGGCGAIGAADPEAGAAPERDTGSGCGDFAAEGIGIQEAKAGGCGLLVLRIRKPERLRRDTGSSERGRRR